VVHGQGRVGDCHLQVRSGGYSRPDFRGGPDGHHPHEPGWLPRGLGGGCGLIPWAAVRPAPREVPNGTGRGRVDPSRPRLRAARAAILDACRHETILVQVEQPVGAVVPVPDATRGCRRSPARTDRPPADPTRAGRRRSARRSPRARHVSPATARDAQQRSGRSGRRLGADDQRRRAASRQPCGALPVGGRGHGRRAVHRSHRSPCHHVDGLIVSIVTRLPQWNRACSRSTARAGAGSGANVVAPSGRSDWRSQRGTGCSGRVLADGAEPRWWCPPAHIGIVSVRVLSPRPDHPAGRVGDRRLIRPRDTCPGRCVAAGGHRALAVHWTRRASG